MLPLDCCQACWPTHSVAAVRQPSLPPPLLPLQQTPTRRESYHLLLLPLLVPEVVVVLPGVLLVLGSCCSWQLGFA